MYAVSPDQTCTVMVKHLRSSQHLFPSGVSAPQSPGSVQEGIPKRRLEPQSLEVLGDEAGIHNQRDTSRQTTCFVWPQQCFNIVWFSFSFYIKSFKNLKIRRFFHFPVSFRTLENLGLWSLPRTGTGQLVDIRICNLSGGGVTLKWMPKLWAL